MKYYQGRSNLAATIFVPVKCGNNCPFCNTNVLYDDFEFDNKYLDNILNCIDLCNKLDCVHEFVITGGEPILILYILKQIVGACTKPVFINTSLPVVGNIDEVIDFINDEKNMIRGVNVSRHIGMQHYIKTADIGYLNKITKNVRVNCIVNEKTLNDELTKFIDYYATSHRMINLRADYRNITPNNLKNRDAISLWLLNHYKYEGSNNCLVCNSEFFSDEDYKVICYHRGTEHSCVCFNDRCYVNDIIISMYGKMYKDWDMVYDNDFINAIYNNEILK